MTPPPSCTWLECGVYALVPWGVELTVLGCTFFSFSEELRANHKSAKASVQKLAAELKLSAKAAVAAKSSSNQAHAEYVPHEVATSVGSVCRVSDLCVPWPWHLQHDGEAPGEAEGSTALCNACTRGLEAEAHAVRAMARTCNLDAWWSPWLCCTHQHAAAGAVVCGVHRDMTNATSEHATALSAVQQERDALQASLDRAQEQLSNNTTTIAGLDGKCTTLSASLAAAQQELEASRESTRADLDAAVRCQVQLEPAVPQHAPTNNVCVCVFAPSLLVQRAERDAAVAAAVADAEAARAELETVTQELVAARSECSQLTSRVAAMATEEAALRTELQSASDNATAHASRASTLEATLAVRVAGTGRFRMVWCGVVPCVVPCVVWCGVGVAFGCLLTHRVDCCALPHRPNARHRKPPRRSL